MSGQPSSIVVEGVQVSLPSYEEAVYGSSGVCAAASAAAPESRVQIVLSEGPQSDTGSQSDCRLLPCNSTSSSSSSSAGSSRSRRHAETVLVHPAPSCSSSSSPSPYSPPSSCSWAAEQPGAAAAAAPLPHDSESSDQHSLLSLTSSEDFADGT